MMFVEFVHVGFCSFFIKKILIVQTLWMFVFFFTRRKSRMRCIGSLPTLPQLRMGWPSPGYVTYGRQRDPRRTIDISGKKVNKTEDGRTTP